MKKKKLIAIILSIFTSLFILISCQKPNNNDDKDNIAIYQNEILPKTDCITRIKKLLDCTNIYFFDCDFSEFEDITITDVSYNISINGFLIKNKKNEEILDLNESADIKLVTNYQIITRNNCFGFSVISSVMRTKANHYSNNEFEYTNPNQIYDKFTFKSTEDLITDRNITHVNNDNKIAMPIKIPQNFYPCELIPYATSQIQDFEKEIKLYTEYDTAVTILTHYKKDEGKSDDDTLLNSITKYFVKNGQYNQH